MTVRPNDRDWDRLDALVDEDPIALRDAAWRLATALAAAEHRAARAEVQAAIRGRAVVMYRERAREAEARIRAVRDVLDWPHLDIDGDAVVHAADIRRALNVKGD